MKTSNLLNFETIYIKMLKNKNNNNNNKKVIEKCVNCNILYSKLPCFEILVSLNNARINLENNLICYLFFPKSVNGNFICSLKSSLKHGTISEQHRPGVCLSTLDNCFLHPSNYFMYHNTRKLLKYPSLFVPNHFYHCCLYCYRHRHQTVYSILEIFIMEMLFQKF